MYVCCKVMLVGKKRECLKVMLGENVTNIDGSCNGLCCNGMMIFCRCGSMSILRGWCA